ncbi:MAG: phospholipase D-like domain-containing protein, partial [Pisciglobus halotolerans]|nr:phospholipase D-like domain-containing protein [Pisciglobus halotolerans]
MYYFILSVFIFYLLYVFISTTLLFRIPSSDLELLDDSFYAKRFISSTESQDRVVLVQDCTDTVNALADLIQQSSSSLDLAFPFEADKKETSFLSALLIEAAERGVVVRLLVDGKTMMTSRHWKDICVSLTQSSTISIRFYEPYSWGLPWTWRNHLNEAFLIQDGKHAFVSSGLTADTTNNQDILIINPLPDSLETSSLYSLHAYFEHIWKHPYSKERTLTTLFSKRRTANQLIQLKKILRLEKEANPNRFDHPIEWISYSFPTSQVTFLHNPIERFLKTPTVWFQLSSLIGITKKQAFMETKAFNPTKQMSTFLSQTNDEH